MKCINAVMCIERKVRTHQNTNLKKKKSKQLLTMENDTKRKYVHIN